MNVYKMIATLSVLLLATNAQAGRITECPELPSEGCKVAGFSAIRVTSTIDPERRRITVRHTQIEPTTDEEVGNPRSETEYAVCIYDHVEGVPNLGTEALLPANSDWDTLLRVPGWRYDDFLGDVNGFVFGRLRPSEKPDRGKMVLRAHGDRTPATAPFMKRQMFAMDPMVTAQIINDTGACWTGDVFTSETNRGRAFKAFGYGGRR